MLWLGTWQKPSSCHLSALPTVRQRPIGQGSVTALLCSESTHLQPVDRRCCGHACFSAATCGQQSMPRVHFAQVSEKPLVTVTFCFLLLSGHVYYVIGFADHGLSELSMFENRQTAGTSTLRNPKYVYIMLHEVRLCIPYEQCQSFTRGAKAGVIVGLCSLFPLSGLAVMSPTNTLGGCKCEHSV